MSGKQCEMLCHLNNAKCYPHRDELGLLLGTEAPIIMSNHQNTQMNRLKLTLYTLLLDLHGGMCAGVPGSRSADPDLG